MERFRFLSRTASYSECLGGSYERDGGLAALVGATFHRAMLHVQAAVRSSCIMHAHRAVSTADEAADGVAHVNDCLNATVHKSRALRRR